MDFNRNQFFFIGLLVLFIGIQVRAVQTYILTPETTQMLAEYSGGPSLAVAQNSNINASSAAASMTGARKNLQPPEWLGWCVLSIGAVLVLHSLAMPKPGGN